MLPSFVLGLQLPANRFERLLGRHGEGVDPALLPCAGRHLDYVWWIGSNVKTYDEGNADLEGTRLPRERCLVLRPDHQGHGT